MTVIEALKSITNYPIPIATLNRVAVERGLEPETDMNAQKFESSNYKLAEADTLMWLTSTPSFSEGGVTISYSEKDKSEMRNKAHAIYIANGETNAAVQFGYKGSSL